MKYKIERAKIAGMRHPQLYLTGWVRAKNFLLIIKGDNKEIARCRGSLYRQDIAKKFGEGKKHNLYGFYKEVPLPDKVKTLEFELRCGGVTQCVFSKHVSFVGRLMTTILMKRRYFLKKGVHCLLKQWYWVYFFKTPKSFFNSETRKTVQALHQKSFPEPVLVGWFPEQYNKWLREFQPCDAVERLSYHPKISIIVPVYNPPLDVLRECIQSVLNQMYTNFELCLVDDCSTDSNVRQVLEEAKRGDERIKVVYCEKNGGISAASNVALEIAEGEFVALLDNDDTLSPNALYENVRALNYNKKLDFLYSDEDKIDSLGQFCDPHFKPDWAPDTLMSYNYVTHFVVIRKKVIDKVGGFRSEYDGAQDYDLFLRVTEQIPDSHIFHIPKILYHWRMSETSTSGDTENKNYAGKVGQKVLQDALKRRKLKGSVQLYEKTFYITNYIPRSSAKVSIIIPTKDNYRMLRQCIKSIRKNTSSKYEIIIVSNNTEEPEALNYLRSLKKQKDITILTINKPFNFSLLNNEAVKIARGQYLLFLNDDTQVITKNWLRIMVGYAERGHVGAVGAKLLFADKTIQHVGVITGLGMKDGPGHPFSTAPGDEKGPLDSFQIPYNYSVVTGACLMVAKKKFLEVGTFDEAFPVNYNDVDLCLALQAKGYYNVCLNQVVLYHYESVTRSISDYKAIYDLTCALERLHNKWGMEIFKHDPYYNINYSRIIPYALNIDKRR